MYTLFPSHIAPVLVMIRVGVSLGLDSTSECVLVYTLVFRLPVAADFGNLPSCGSANSCKSLIEKNPRESAMKFVRYNLPKLVEEQEKSKAKMTEHRFRRAK